MAPGIAKQLLPELSQSYHWMLVVIGVPDQVAGTSVSTSPTWGEAVDEADAGEIPGGVPFGWATARDDGAQPSRVLGAAQHGQQSCKARNGKQSRNCAHQPTSGDCAPPLFGQSPWPREHGRP